MTPDRANFAKTRVDGIIESFSVSFNPPSNASPEVMARHRGKFENVVKNNLRGLLEDNSYTVAIIDPSVDGFILEALKYAGYVEAHGHVGEDEYYMYLDPTKKLFIGVPKGTELFNHIPTDNPAADLLTDYLLDSETFV
jgi:hypothetical protein